MTNPKGAAWYLGDSADLETKLDTVDAVVDALAISLGTVDGIVDAMALEQARIGKANPYGWTMAIKAVTFANTVADVPLFTVTGDVIVRLIAMVKTACASAGACNASVGIAGATAAIIALTDVTLLIQDEIWHDVTPDAKIEAISIASMAGFILSGGQSVLLTRSAQIDSGAITFYCLWTPLSAAASVVAA